jgi:hypothetical protein
MGLPYPTQMFYTNSPEFAARLRKGKNHIRYPLVRFGFDHSCSEIYQPIMPWARKEMKELYDTSYVESICSDPSNGIGKVFHADERLVLEYPLEKSEAWKPHPVWDDSVLLRLIRKQWLETQIRMVEYGPTTKKTDSSGIVEGKRQMVKTQIRIAKEFNQFLLEKYVR